VQAKVRGGSPEEEVKLRRGGRICATNVMTTTMNSIKTIRWPPRTSTKQKLVNLTIRPENVTTHRKHCVDAAYCYTVVVALSVSVSVSVCLCMCWANGWAVQKRLNRSRCRLRVWVTGPKKSRVRRGSRSHYVKGQFWELSDRPKSTGSLILWCMEQNNSIVNNGMTERLLQPIAMLQTGRCHLHCSP